MIAGLPAASAIVLAGGRSSRFGRDKLAEPLDGRPLLEHAIAAAAAVARDVVVLGREATEGGDAPAMIGGVTIRRAADAAPFPGPLVALPAGLELVREPIAVVVAGDMPTLAPDVLAALVRVLAATEDAAAAALVYRGRRERLPFALRVGAATPVVARLVAAGERRLGALLEELPTRDLAEAEWRPLDPAAATLRDVDVPSDLPR